MKLTVEVQRDHIERVANGYSVVDALAELIWNALDADATRVDVELERNELGGVDCIRVTDNGDGISFRKAQETFSSLGDSWKKSVAQTRRGRHMHGSAGEGRFAAFALGSHVRWLTLSKADNEGATRFEISGSTDALQEFYLSELDESDEPSGTTVIVTALSDRADHLGTDSSRSQLTRQFALYIRAYPEVRIVHDGAALDPAVLEDHSADLEVEPVEFLDGTKSQPAVTVIEWKKDFDRELHLCDQNGFSLATQSPGIHAPGFHFTAYVKSPKFRELRDAGLLDLGELHRDAAAVIGATKDALRDHFRKRQAELTQNTVERWKEEEVYPFEGEPKNAVEVAERQVFDVVALQVNEYLPQFAESDTAAKKLSFNMLRSAIERSPVETRLILQEVLQLPPEKRDELAALLERTKLSAIITAAKLVADRLEFLAGLEPILFDREVRKNVQERKHLHRILAENTWLFGEEYSLSVDDQSLDEVLRRHLKILGRDELADESRVEKPDGGTGIVDLMLSRAIPQADARSREHLVVELKRPGVRLSPTETTQIEEYAFAVADDERFRDTNTRWNFWLVSNDLTKHTRRKLTNQGDRPDFLLHRVDDGRIDIWVTTWGQILQQANARLRWYEEKLEYDATHDSGLEFLRSTHGKYLPANAAE